MFYELGRTLITETVLAPNQISVQPLTSTGKASNPAFTLLRLPLQNAKQSQPKPKKPA